MRPLFAIDVIKQGETVIVVVVGEIDLAAGPALEHALHTAEASPAKTVVIDVDRVTFMDATGLRVIVGHALSDEHRGRIKMTRGSRQVRRLLEITGLDAHLPVWCGGRGRT